ncbi:KilA-N domain-containing protein [Duncaniella muris]|uniref:KilA-N domain-containing protein n=1 Tax=Duncaniella muris TaxID=2094150 RepID=UPI0025B1F55D|nr:KilA-N domain-containing protein [Duncaniella muris]
MLNSENQIFQYNGSPISFQKGNSVMVNATEMAKPFGKLAKDWLSNKSTKEFISTLSAVRTIPLTDLVVVRQGGNVEQGTWLHEDVAVEFARWLSPTFAIWCNDRIKELLTKGRTSIYQSSRHATGPKVSDRIRAAKFLASFLNLNESSKLLLAKSIAEPLGLPTPDYTPSKGVLRSCAELLKEHAAKLSPQQFNQRMIQHGYMAELTRPSSKGSVKKFKSIIGDGLQYGENQVNPNNPKSTQPLYYADKFGELMNLLSAN